MTNLSTVKNPTGKVAEMFEVIKKKLGKVPNMMATMAQSPAVLESYLSFSGALNQTSLSGALREKIALAVSEVNSCDYCLAAHTTLGSLAGVSEEEIKANRTARSSDPKEEVALKFAASIVKNKGRVSPEEIEQVRSAGFSDAALTEIIAVVALNIFTNYFNHIADPEIDFPRVS